MSKTDENWREFGRAIVQDPRPARRGFVRYSVGVAILGFCIGVCLTLALSQI